MEFDLITFLTAGAENAPAVIFLVLGLTHLAGRFGAKGQVQLGIATGLGVLFGGGLQLASVGPPADYADYFSLMLYAGLMGLVPSLVYDTGKEIVAKATSRVIAGGDGLGRQ